MVPLSDQPDSKMYAHDDASSELLRQMLARSDELLDALDSVFDDGGCDGSPQGVAALASNPSRVESALCPPSSRIACLSCCLSNRDRGKRRH